MSSSVTTPGDVTLGCHPEIKGLMAMLTDQIYCCPPIPRSLAATARKMLPPEVWEKGESEQDFFRIAMLKENYRTYWTTKPIGQEVLKEWINEYAYEVFNKHSPWTGYAVYEIKKIELIGLAIFKPGYSFGEGLVDEESYKAFPVDEGSGALTAEIEMDGFVVAAYVDLYQEVITTLLTVAKKFIELGYKINGHPVKRLITTVIDPLHSAELGDTKGVLGIRDSALQRIFGESLGVLLPGDPRNCSGYLTRVYGYDVIEIEEPEDEKAWV